jgi:hypothetical protein
MRLNAFREERADSDLRVAVTEQSKASEKHASAEKDVDLVGAWKTGSQGAALDLTVYGVALELERLAMDRAAALQAELREREGSTQKAREALTHAARATRVSNKRGKREKLRVESESEKRQFDQISDVWLNNREKGRD